MAKIAFNFPAGAATAAPPTAAPPTADPSVAGLARIIAVPDTTDPVSEGPTIDVQSTVAQQSAPPAGTEEEVMNREIAELKVKLAAAKKAMKAQVAPRATAPAPVGTEAAPPTPAAPPAPFVAPAAPAAFRKGPRKAVVPASAPAPAPAPAPAAVPPSAPVVERARPAIATSAPQAPELTTRNVHQIHNNQAVATRGAMFDDDGAADIEFSDLVVPRLNIVQKVGDLSQVFEPGTLVLGKTLALDQPAKLVVASFMPKKYVEKIEGGATMGRIAKTPQEVVNMGGTIDYNEAKETKRPLFQTLATALVILERGVDDPEAAFPFTYQGKGYALVFWSMKGTAYTNAAKVFFTARKTGLFKTSRSAMISGYLKQWVLLETEAKKYSTNWAMIPIVNLAEETTAEFRAWVHQMLRPDAGAVDTASGD